MKFIFFRVLFLGSLLGFYGEDLSNIFVVLVGGGEVYFEIFLFFLKGKNILLTEIRILRKYSGIFVVREGSR